MKVLTLHQPWASFSAIGVKTIETRSWETSYRGPLALHAAITFPLYARDAACSEPLNSIYQTAKADGRLQPHPSALEGFSCLPLGCIVAVCYLVRCIKVQPFRWNTAPNRRRRSNDSLPSTSISLQTSRNTLWGITRRAVSPGCWQRFSR